MEVPFKAALGQGSLCDWPCPVSVYACVYLEHVLSFATAEPAKKKAVAMSPSLGRDPRSFGHSGAGLEWLGGSGRSLYLT